MRKEELRRFPSRYIECVNGPDGHVLRSSREIREAFRTHFQDRFARCPDLQVQEFRNYLADFPRLSVAEAASCEGVVTECEVRSALNQVGLKKSRHVRGELDDYRPITLLNTEIKILARVLASRLQLVASDLIGPEQNYAVKGRSIRVNLHLVRQIQERIKDDSKAVWVNLDQSKAFDRVDHRFLAAVLETAGFEPEFRKWISMQYHNPQAVVQVNGRCSGAFAIERSVRQGCSLFPLLYVLALEPLLRRLRDWGGGSSGPARNLANRQRPSQDFRVRRWHHGFCVQASGNIGCEEGGREIPKGSRCQSQL